MVSKILGDFSSRHWRKTRFIEPDTSLRRHHGKEHVVSDSFLRQKSNNDNGVVEFTTGSRGTKHESSSLEKSNFNERHRYPFSR